MLAASPRYVVACLLLALATASSRQALALDPTRAITQLNQAVWTNEDGLPQSSVQAILQTRDGYLWLGTQEGLVRFDGSRFRVFDRSNTPELRSNVVWALCEDAAGALWVGTDGGLTRFLGGSFTTFGPKDGLAGQLVRSLAADPDGSLWVGTDGGGLSLLRGGTFTSIGKEQGLPAERVRALLVDREKALWAGPIGGGLLEVKTGAGMAVVLPGERVAALLEARDGTIWVGTLGKGLARWKDGSLTFLATKDGLANDFVWSVHEDSDLNLWIGTEGGLCRLPAGGLIRCYAEKDGLPSDRVWAIREDRERNLWIGTDGGLVRLQQGKFLFYGAREGLANDVVMSVLEDAAGSLWIGTASGLSRKRQTEFTNWTLRDGLPNDRIWAFAEGRDGTIWIGTDAGLARVKDGKVSRVEGVPAERIRSLLVDSKGTLWVGTLGGGLKRLQGESVATFGEADGLASSQVRFLHEDQDGVLWILCSGGLTRLKDGVFTTLRKRDGLPNDLLVCLHQDPDGTVWIGTFGGGLLRYRDGAWTQLTTREGLFDDVIYRILPDARGGFFMSSSKGIARVVREELEDFAAGKRTFVSSVSYGKADGMPNSECNGGSQPAGWKARDGSLWFPTIKGVVRIHPEEIPTNPIPPPVVIEQLVADDRVYGRADRMSVPPGRKRFELHYAGLSFVAPAKVRFRYKLEGLDEDWVEAGTRRVAYYTNLPPGQHRFQVSACNNDGVWSERPASLTFALRPFFYQTTLFQLLLGTSVLALALGLHKLRTYRLKRRSAELEGLVQERTRSLEEAQQKIARLAESASDALNDIPSWSRTMAEDLARTIGAQEIGVFLVEKDVLSSLTATRVQAPTLEDIRTAPRGAQAGRTAGEEVVPVVGLSGQLYGALVVSGGGQSTSDAAGRLLASFAHQLGSALEVQKMRRELASVAARKVASLRELLDQGIDLVKECPDCGRCYDQRASRCEEDGAELSEPRAIPYRVLGRYRLCRFLGQGGMGMVFSARDERLERDVALKILRSDQLFDPETRLRIEREARTIARIDHPGVVAIYDSGALEDGSTFLVMELLRGIDLGGLIAVYGRGTPKQVAELLRQGAAALAAAHRAGVIHRDIKPANVFIEHGEGETREAAFVVKVLDFGLAKSISMESTLTQAGVILGTPAYMSPEQILGRSLGPESDLYSFAVVAFQALTGIRLVSSGEFAELASEVLHDVPPLVSSICGEFPPQVDDAFRRALAKNPKDRPAGVEEWVASFVDVLAGVPFQGRGWPLGKSTLPARSPLPESDETSKIPPPTS